MCPSVSMQGSLITKHYVRKSCDRDVQEHSAFNKQRNDAPVRSPRIRAIPSRHTASLKITVNHRVNAALLLLGYSRQEPGAVRAATNTGNWKDKSEWRLQTSHYTRHVLMPSLFIAPAGDRRLASPSPFRSGRRRRLLHNVVPPVRPGQSTGAFVLRFNHFQG